MPWHVQYWGKPDKPQLREDATMNEKTDAKKTKPALIVTYRLSFSTEAVEKAKKWAKDKGFEYDGYEDLLMMDAMNAGILKNEQHWDYHGDDSSVIEAR